MWRAILFSSVTLIAGCSTTHGPCESARSTAPEALFGAVWEWEATDAPTDACVVPTPERYRCTLQFLPEGKVRARFDCNTGGGPYTISAGKLSFGPLTSTRKACPPDSLDGRYMKDLQQVVAFFVQDEVLYLGLSGDGGTMCTCQAPTGPPWIPTCPLVSEILIAAGSGLAFCTLPGYNTSWIGFRQFLTF